MDGRHIIMLVVCPLIVVGNGLLLTFLGMLLAGRGGSKSGGTTPMTHTRFLLFHLAMAEFLMGCPILPMVVIAEQQRVSDDPWLCLVSVCMTMMSISVCSFLLIAIGVERYLAILKPLRYQALVTAGRVIFVGFLCWAMGLILGLAPLLGWNTLVGWRSEVCNHTHPYNHIPSFTTSSSIDDTTSSGRLLKPLNVCIHSGDPHLPKGYCKFTTVLPGSYTGVFFLGFNLPLWVCMLWLYGRIMMEAQRQAKHTTTMTASSSPQQPLYNMERANYKALRLISAIVASYLLAWGPVLIYYSVLYKGFTREVLCPEDNEMPYWTYLTVTCLLYGSSAVNPWIYGLGDKNLRQLYLGTWVGQNLRRLHNRWRNRQHVVPAAVQVSIKPSGMVKISPKVQRKAEEHNDDGKTE